MPTQKRDGIQAVGIGNPTGAPRGYTREPPAHVVTAPHLGLLRNQEPQKRAPNVTKTNDGEIV
jgi:hypothetical protein